MRARFNNLTLPRPVVHVNFADAILVPVSEGYKLRIQDRITGAMFMGEFDSYDLPMVSDIVEVGEGFGKGWRMIGNWGDGTNRNGNSMTAPLASLNNPFGTPPNFMTGDYTFVVFTNQAGPSDGGTFTSAGNKSGTSATGFSVNVGPFSYPSSLSFTTTGGTGTTRPSAWTYESNTSNMKFIACSTSMANDRVSYISHQGNWFTYTSPYPPDYPADQELANGDWRFGERGGSFGDGSIITEFALYNVELTETQIRTLYNAKKIL